MCLLREMLGLSEQWDDVDTDYWVVLSYFV